MDSERKKQETTFKILSSSFSLVFIITQRLYKTVNISEESRNLSKRRLTHNLLQVCKSFLQSRRLLFSIPMEIRNTKWVSHSRENSFYRKEKSLISHEFPLEVIESSLLRHFLPIMSKRSKGEMWAVLVAAWVPFSLISDSWSCDVFGDFCDGKI